MKGDFRTGAGNRADFATGMERGRVAGYAWTGHRKKVVRDQVKRDKRPRLFDEARERVRRRLRTEKQKVDPVVQAARDRSAKAYAGIRDELSRKGKCEALNCRVLIHRIVITAAFFPTNSFPWKAFENLPGARSADPEQLWGQKYSEVRRFYCDGGIREIAIEHKRTVGYVPAFQIALEPRFQGGWTFADLKSVLGLLRTYKLNKVEVAFDFPIGSIIDLQFLQKYGLFGKTPPRYLAVNPVHDSWGGRKAMKFVRLYARLENDTVRAELEVHSRMLRQHGINTPEDFPQLIELLVRKHILFTRLNKEKLVKHLRRKEFTEGRIKSILQQVRDKDECLWDAKRYLSKRVKLKNIHRHLAHLSEVNQIVREAAERWVVEWRKAQE